jgi:pteridine reductase
MGRTFANPTRVGQGSFIRSSLTSTKGDMTIPLDAPHALVTGGGIRVGAALVRALARDGYRVWIHCRQSLEPARALQRELGPSILGVVQADLSDAAQRETLIATLSNERGPGRGRLDLLINSAASFECGAFEGREDSDLQRVLATNLIAPISLARGLLPALRRAEANETRGPSIINIVDLGGISPWRNYLDHCTAKAGLIMATKAMALELGPGVRVNAIAPGTVLWPDAPEFAENHPLRQSLQDTIPLGRIGTPEDVAFAALYLAKARFVSGQVLNVDGGRSADCGR